MSGSFSKYTNGHYYKGIPVIGKHRLPKFKLREIAALGIPGLKKPELATWINYKIFSSGKFYALPILRARSRKITRLIFFYCQTANNSFNVANLGAGRRIICLLEKMFRLFKSMCGGVKEEGVKYFKYHISGNNLFFLFVSMLA